MPPLLLLFAKVYQHTNTITITSFSMLPFFHDDAAAFADAAALIDITLFFRRLMMLRCFASRRQRRVRQMSPLRRCFLSRRLFSLAFRQISSYVFFFSAYFAICRCCQPRHYFDATLMLPCHAIADIAIAAADIFDADAVMSFSRRLFHYHLFFAVACFFAGLMPLFAYIRSDVTMP